MLKRRKRKLRIFSIFKKVGKFRNSKAQLDENHKRSQAFDQIEAISNQKDDKFADKATNEQALETSPDYCSHKDANNDDHNQVNNQKIRIKSKNKENHEYVEKVRNQVKEVLQENYDDSIDNLFNQFENNGYINKDNFLFRLIFMILKKYGFIDIIDDNGEIDPNAIDAILKSIINDAYKMMNEDKNEIYNEYKCYFIEKTGFEDNQNCYNNYLYDDED